MQTEQPLGYWLKLLDRLIEATFDRALADVQLARRHWQALNVLKAEPRSENELLAALQPFWDEAAIGLDQVLEDLGRRGWIAQNHLRQWALTIDGEEAFARLARNVDVVRGRLLDGITAETYTATLGVLRRMVANMQSVAAPAAD